MKMKRALTPLAIAVAALVSAQQAAADIWNDSNFIIRVGASWVDPDDSDDEFKLSENWTTAGFDLDSDTTWNISGVWQPVEHWGVELMYIGDTSFDMDLRRIRDDAGDFDVDYDLGSFDANYSNAFVNWYPLSRDCMGQPYVGIGVNYTDFSDAGFTRALNDDLIDSGETVDGASLGLSHSWGVTGQVGVDFRFGRDSAFLVNAAVLYVDTDTDFNVYYRSPRNPDVVVRESVSDVDFSPWVFNLGVGYSF